MLIACWSVKGGAGVSVTSAALALTLARQSPCGVLLVDLRGDVPAVLGVTAPAGPGVTEWLGGGPDVTVDALGRLETDVGSGVSLLPRGEGTVDACGRIDLLAGVLSADARPVVVDVGVLGPDAGGGAPDDETVAHRLAASATHSWLVTRPCYLALRRISEAPLIPSGVVLINEPGRALGRRDVEDAVGATVVAEVAIDPQVARAVDAGLLMHRVPRPLARALRHAA